MAAKRERQPLVDASDKTSPGLARGFAAAAGADRAHGAECPLGAKRVSVHNFVAFRSTWSPNTAVAPVFPTLPETLARAAMNSGS